MPRKRRVMTTDPKDSTEDSTQRESLEPQTHQVNNSITVFLHYLYVKWTLMAGLFFVHFQKTQGPKNSTSKKTQGHFLPKNSICRDFLRLHIKNSMQMTSISIHFLKQMVSIDNYKEDNFFPAINNHSAHLKLVMW